jgi:prepilin-type N-terminal cleavage/methylation domain-containing protein
LRTNRGFTLVEVLIATMILATALVALNSSWTGSLMAFRKAKQVQLINSLLKGKITELEIKYRELGFTEIPESESGKFDDYKNLSWSSEVKELDFPDLGGVLAAQDGGVDETTLLLIRQMTEYFSKAIKELKVTVTWTVRERKVEYSVSTYLVNYDQELTGIGGLGGGG